MAPSTAAPTTVQATTGAPTVAPARALTVPTTPTQTSKGSISARPSVSPYERGGSNKNNPQHEGLMQMMQVSMLQHDQYMEEERTPRGEEPEDRLAMQQMLATAVGGAVAAKKKFTNDEED
jgi:hypothetical protein